MLESSRSLHLIALLTAGMHRGLAGPFWVVGRASSAQLWVEAGLSLFTLLFISEFIYSFEYSRNSVKLPKFI
jgi:hypothetical protein